MLFLLTKGWFNHSKIEVYRWSCQSRTTMQRHSVYLTRFLRPTVLNENAQSYVHVTCGVIFNILSTCWCENNHPLCPASVSVYAIYNFRNVFWLCSLYLNALVIVYVCELSLPLKCVYVKGKYFCGCRVWAQLGRNVESSMILQPVVKHDIRMGLHSY